MVGKERHNRPEEITPEMISAGSDAFYGPDWGHEPVERAVVRIYRAMRRAQHDRRPRAQSQDDAKR